MNSTELPTFITVKELAVLLRTSTTSIYRKVPDWPHHRFGTVILFSESDVSAILQLGKVPPQIDAANQRYLKKPFDNETSDSAEHKKGSRRRQPPRPLAPTQPPARN